MNNDRIDYDNIKNKYSKNDKIISLKNSETYIYSGFLTIVGFIGYDSFNENLLLYDNGELATVTEKGIDHEHIALMIHIKNVRETCKRLKCSNSELLNKDYINELGYN
jgi:hypothetical protein